MADAKGSYSESLWRLHRNSILLSSLLLLVCLPGVGPSSKQSFLWLEINGIGLNGVRLIAFAAATYAIIAFLFEWYFEAYAHFVEMHGVATQTLFKIAEVSQAVSRLAIDARLNLVKAAEQLAALPKERPLPIVLPSADHSLIFNEIRKEFDSWTEKYSVLTPDDENHFRITKRTWTEKGLPYSQDIEDIISRGKQRVVAAKRQSLNEGFKLALGSVEQKVLIHSAAAVERITNNLRTVSEKVEKLGYIERDSKSAIVRMRVRMIAGRVGLSFRTFIVLSGVPIAIYTIAVSHWLWQVGVHWFSSPINALIS